MLAWALGSFDRLGFVDRPRDKGMFISDAMSDAVCDAMSNEAPISQRSATTSAVV